LRLLAKKREGSGRAKLIFARDLPLAFSLLNKGFRVMKKWIKRALASLGIAFAIWFAVGVAIEMVSISRSSYGDFNYRLVDNDTLRIEYAEVAAQAGVSGVFYLRRGLIQ